MNSYGPLEPDWETEPNLWDRKEDIKKKKEKAHDTHTHRSNWVSRPSPDWAKNRTSVYYVSRPDKRQADTNPKAVNVNWCLNQVGVPSTSPTFPHSRKVPAIHSAVLVPMSGMLNARWRALRC